MIIIAIVHMRTLIIKTSLCKFLELLQLAFSVVLKDILVRCLCTKSVAEVSVISAADRKLKEDRPCSPLCTLIGMLPY